MTEIRAVVFDFGGVIITPITNKLSVLADRHGVDTMTMLEVMMGPRYESTDHPWHQLERGERPLDDLQAAVTPIAAERGITFDGDEYDVLMDAQTYSLVEPTVDLIDELAETDLRLALLTNSMREFRPSLERDVDLAKFDVVIDSSEVGSRKPEPEIYRITQDRLGVGPESIVYLDDFHHNLGPAIDLGWQIIHVTDPHLALGALRGLVSS